MQAVIGRAGSTAGFPKVVGRTGRLLAASKQTWHPRIMLRMVKNVRQLINLYANEKSEVNFIKFQKLNFLAQSSRFFQFLPPIDKTTRSFTRPRDIQWCSLGNRQTTWPKYLVVLNLATELV
jgi:hypothetical protein